MANKQAKPTKIPSTTNLFSSTEDNRNLPLVNDNLEIHSDTLLNYCIRCYEGGFRDAHKPKFSKWRTSFLSFSFTFLITFFTCSDFNFIWNDKNVSFNWMRWVFLGASFVALILYIVSLAKKAKEADDMPQTRDATIERIIKEQIKKNASSGKDDSNESLRPFE